MEDLVKAVSTLVSEEYQRAEAEHGGAAHSMHEGYALIKEEVEEAQEEMTKLEQQTGHFWTEVKTDDLTYCHHYLDKIRTVAILGACDLIQVAVMADTAMAGIGKAENE